MVEIRLHTTMNSLLLVGPLHTFQTSLQKTVLNSRDHQKVYSQENLT